MPRQPRKKFVIDATEAQRTSIVAAFTSILCSISALPLGDFKYERFAMPQCRDKCPSCSRLCTPKVSVTLNSCGDTVVRDFRHKLEQEVEPVEEQVEERVVGEKVNEPVEERIGEEVKEPVEAKIEEQVKEPVEAKIEEQGVAEHVQKRKWAAVDDGEDEPARKRACVAVNSDETATN